MRHIAFISASYIRYLYVFNIKADILTNVHEIEKMRGQYIQLKDNINKYPGNVTIDNGAYIIFNYKSHMKLPNFKIYSLQKDLNSDMIIPFDHFIYPYYDIDKKKEVLLTNMNNIVLWYEYAKKDGLIERLAPVVKVWDHNTLDILLDFISNFDVKYICVGGLPTYTHTVILNKTHKDEYESNALMRACALYDIIKFIRKKFNSKVMTHVFAPNIPQYLLYSIGIDRYDTTYALQYGLRGRYMFIIDDRIDDVALSRRLFKLNDNEKQEIYNTLKSLCQCKVCQNLENLSTNPYAITFHNIHIMNRYTEMLPYIDLSKFKWYKEFLECKKMIDNDNYNELREYLLDMNNSAKQKYISLDSFIHSNNNIL